LNPPVIYVAKQVEETRNEPVEQIKDKFLLRTMRLENALMVNIGLTALDTRKYINTNELLDSGATGMFMGKTFSVQQKLSMRKLVKEILVLMEQEILGVP
jgi:hypothetical protein